MLFAEQFVIVMFDSYSDRIRAGYNSQYVTESGL